MRKLLFAVTILCLAAAPAFAGNGAPNGAHYNLNILGKDNCSPSDLTGSNRHTIQVKLNYAVDPSGQLASVAVDKTNRIYLQEGDFQVIDGNACDPGGAIFQLPANPYTCAETDPSCLNTDPTFQEYTVWVRALGTPGGKATMTTCATDPVTLEIVCSTENVLLVRTKGPSKFDNVTKQLTTVCLDTSVPADGKCDIRYPLFADDLQDYFWNYQNSGLRLAQMRFYMVPD